MKKNKVGKVMHKFKEHELYSHSGDMVKNKAQAIAIALSEQRKQNRLHEKRKK